MKVPAISVAMSVYNGERFLAEAIESVLAQTLGDFEFLILDDGSRDGSRDIVDFHATRDKRIRAISRENRGLVASLNQLLELAQAPLVARMDADDACMPNRFERQFAFLTEHPDHGVVGSWCEEIDEYGRPSPTCTIDHPVSHEAFLEAIEAGGALMAHPSVMFRRDIVRSVGGYHGAFRHCEDYDLWLRLATVTRLANLPERLIRYRHSEGQVSVRHATEQQTGAAVALLAYQERRAGRPDPTADLARLPPIDELDALFGRSGVSRWVRSRVATGLLYSREGMGGEGFKLVLRHLREGGTRQGMWRTVARLIRFGEPLRAARLVAALVSN
jgi:glycosyltransferase involved in cell wall biosynthesis